VAVKKTALIFGVNGQDGSYLAKFLLSKDYVVWGTSRDAQSSKFENLKFLRIFQHVNLLSALPEDLGSVLKAIKLCKPQEIYYLSGQSSVSFSFENPAETLHSFVTGILNILEACRISELRTRIYHAGSSECFGDTNNVPAKEDTPFAPRSPYAVAKASASWLVNTYRQSYNLYACTGTLFNHESPLRPGFFVTQKIIYAAKRIANGSNEKLQLGRIDISRDWGWAPEYVEAMWLMLQQPNPQDFVIATGVSHTLQEFVSTAFAFFGLDWQSHIEISENFLRPNDITSSKADPSLVKSQLGWEAQYKMSDVIKEMIVQSK
jgi:GDPmannose 4,6-dehydratase